MDGRPSKTKNTISDTYQETQQQLSTKNVSLRTLKGEIIHVPFMQLVSRGEAYFYYNKQVLFEHEYKLLVEDARQVGLKLSDFTTSQQYQQAKLAKTTAETKAKEQALYSHHLHQQQVEYQRQQIAWEREQAFAIHEMEKDKAFLQQEFNNQIDKVRAKKTKLAELTGQFNTLSEQVKAESQLMQQTQQQIVEVHQVISQNEQVLTRMNASNNTQAFQQPSLADPFIHPAKRRQTGSTTFIRNELTQHNQATGFVPPTPTSDATDSLLAINLGNLTADEFINIFATDDTNADPEIQKPRTDTSASNNNNNDKVYFYMDGTQLPEKALAKIKRYGNRYMLKSYEVFDETTYSTIHSFLARNRILSLRQGIHSLEQLQGKLKARGLTLPSDVAALITSISMQPTPASTQPSQAPQRQLPAQLSQQCDLENIKAIQTSLDKIFVDCNQSITQKQLKLMQLKNDALKLQSEIKNDLACADEISQRIPVLDMKISQKKQACENLHHQFQQENLLTTQPTAMHPVNMQSQSIPRSNMQAAAHSYSEGFIKEVPAPGGYSFTSVAIPAMRFDAPPTSEHVNRQNTVNREVPRYTTSATMPSSRQAPVQAYPEVFFKRVELPTGHAFESSLIIGANSVAVDANLGPAPQPIPTINPTASENAGTQESNLPSSPIDRILHALENIDTETLLNFAMWNEVDSGSNNSFDPSKGNNLSI